MTPLHHAKRQYQVVMTELTELFDRLDVPVTPDVADAVHDAVVAPHYDQQAQAGIRAAEALGLSPATDPHALQRLLDELIAGDRTSVAEARLLADLRDRVAA